MAPTFAELTTMRVGGASRDFAMATETAQLVELVRRADTDAVPLLVMGGGSNLVVGDAGWDGLTVKIATSGIDISGTTVSADAGVNWDELVALTVADGLSGLEALSGIPGSVGGTPVQNVGAFGAHTSDVLTSVTLLDRDSGEISQWGSERCGFGSHRQSTFKNTDRFVLLRVTYELRRSRQSAPMTFAEVARRLDIEVGGTADPVDVREVVLSQRRRRGSIYDPADSDTWGVGSFFLNPVLQEVPPQADGSPRFPDPKGTKVPAGWLIERAGFAPGYGAEWGRGSVRLSTKHALVITNRGDATTSEVMGFAGHIRDGVEERFGIRLTPECRLVNCALGVSAPESPVIHS
ncbi:UDP-N-acetylmuramate dehydrogenase [Jatrophihabitans sp. GAS493]|uniref:UDP-N-acetylmuramate dehydrogenase n=1 Tax=Jatrophihabitans sp. GAS493 TaxID=1907575 RepID=UPI0018D50A9F|nr:UDP-N-acetylmuramate dehydrogenase [Jatrophihabitans sp. GAS493]